MGLLQVGPLGIIVLLVVIWLDNRRDRAARLIADQVRMRSDLGRLERREGARAELQLVLARGRDLVADQTRRGP